MTAPAVQPIEIKFVTGTFLDFRAVSKVHCGKITTDVREGDVVSFDGQVMKYQGTEYNYPEFKASLKVGWFVPVKDNISTYIAKASDMKVRPAQDKTGGKKPDKAVPITVASDEKQVKAFVGRKVVAADDLSDEGEKVGTVKRTLIKQDSEERDVGQARPPRNSAGVRVDMADTAAAVISSPKSARIDMTDNEDARPVGKMLRSAVQKTVISDPADAARKTQQLDEGPRTRLVAAVAPAARPKSEVLPSKSGTEIYAAEAEKVEDMIDALNPEDRARIIANDRRAKAEASAKKAGAPVKAAPAKPIAPVKAVAPKAAPVAPAKAVAAPTKAVAKLAPKAAPTKAVPVAKAAAPIKKTPPKTIEQIVMEGDEIDLGGGLKWDMKIHWLQRSKLAADLYAKNPEDMERVLAIETPAVAKFTRKILEKRLERAAAAG